MRTACDGPAGNTYLYDFSDEQDKALFSPWVERSASCNKDLLFLHALSFGLTNASLRKWAAMNNIFLSCQSELVQNITHYDRLYRKGSAQILMPAIKVQQK